jgi:hypothetical protein
MIVSLCNGRTLVRILASNDSEMFTLIHSLMKLEKFYTLYQSLWIMSKQFVVPWINVTRPVELSMVDESKFLLLLFLLFFSSKLENKQ